MKTQKKKKDKYHNKKKWFDNDCLSCLKNLKETGRLLRTNPYDNNLLQKYRLLRKKYKQLVKYKRQNFKMTSFRN
jgi:hypothetical protein